MIHIDVTRSLSVGFSAQHFPALVSQLSIESLTSKGQSEQPETTKLMVEDLFTAVTSGLFFCAIPAYSAHEQSINLTYREITARFSAARVGGKRDIIHL